METDLEFINPHEQAFLNMALELLKTIFSGQTIDTVV